MVGRAYEARVIFVAESKAVTVPSMTGKWL